MILPILTEPNPLLHKQAKPIADARIISAEMKKLATDLIETMRAKDGVGLAATQAGRLEQICVVAVDLEKQEKREIVLINPRWEKIGLRKETDDEGCLSVPEIFGKVKRYKKIRVFAKNLLGNNLEFVAEDLLARIIQHEVDHLNGILFTEKAKGLHKIDKSAGK
ncbi:peptide deformylase [Patescibacteria group bacterium]|nr:MAG: peptide deformylase [Patescibacteria group bacterium]